LGSGFVIDAQNGYIVTNNHVIADADEVKITLFDDRVLNAEIIGRDEKTDLAVLKVDPKEAKEANLIPVPFGNSDTMRVGDWVIAIGNPFGLGGTVTAGIISARQRDINAGPYDDFIQTDASINRGNSGGPMFNLKGEVIGINTAIYSPSGGSVGIGFAIPSSMAQPILDQLIKFGRTRRGWLGVRIQNVTDDIADSLGIEKAKGALVASVTKDGPAEKAGLKAGDVILEFDSKEVTAMRSLPRIVAETDIDKDVPIKIWRDGRPKTVTAKIGELEEAEKKGILENDTVVSGEGDARGYKIKNLDVSAANLDDALRQEFGISPDIAGVVITHIEDGSDAAQKGLRPGDVIIEVNQNPVLTPEEVNELVQNARRSGRSSALFLINREGDMRFVALRFSAQ
jgi:serine protease Do